MPIFATTTALSASHRVYWSGLSLIANRDGVPHPSLLLFPMSRISEDTVFGGIKLPYAGSVVDLPSTAVVSLSPNNGCFKGLTLLSKASLSHTMAVSCEV